MKKILLTALAAIFTLAVWAQNDGLACEKAIYVDSTLVQPIDADTEFWFTANTEDLPLTVYFFPDDSTEALPEVYIDFTCEPGVYEDENVQAIVELAADFEIYFPFGAVCGEVEIDGEKVFMMEYERDMLELLDILGVNYSIPVYVSFRSPVSGTVQMSNVKTSTLCTDIHQRVEMNDTIYLQAEKDGLFYFPVNEWKDKKMSFTWTGSTPIFADLETDCDFEELTSGYNFDFATEIDGKYTQLVSESGIDNFIRDSKDGNIYVRFMAPENGQVYVSDYVDHGAVTINSCIKNLKSTAIDFPADSMALKAEIPTKSYRIEADKLQGKNVRLQWKATENQLAVAYFANFCGFELKASDPDVLDTIHFVFNEEAQVMYADIPSERMNRITAQNTEGWLFMQIYRQEAGLLSWDTYEIVIPDCDSKSRLFMPNDSLSMPAKSYNTSYKMPVKNWSNAAHTLTWTGRQKAYVFIADTCTYPLASNNEHVGKYFELAYNQTIELTKEDMGRLVTEYVDEFENIYLRLRSNGAGVLVAKQVIETGIQNAVVNHGVTTQLVMINQSLYIQVTDGTTTKYYDLVGRPVVKL